MLISLTITLYVCVFDSYDLVVRGDKDNIVVRRLRKQLMQENYDYSTESNETQKNLKRSEIKLDKLESKDEFKSRLHFNNTSERKMMASQSKDATSKFGFFTRSSVTDDSQVSYEKEVGKIYKKALEHPISEKDLLYYMDDEKLLKVKLGPETRDMTARRSVDYRGYDKKYKFLKIRRQYRRNSPRRFIQEEGDDGVFIISLDNGTFPEFRLPRSRRQYMHDHGEVAAEEDEIPPPPLLNLNIVGGDVKPLSKAKV